MIVVMLQSYSLHMVYRRIFVVYGRPLFLLLLEEKITKAKQNKGALSWEQTLMQN
jgi:hypothetical protein